MAPQLCQLLGNRLCALLLINSTPPPKPHLSCRLLGTVFKGLGRRHTALCLFPHESNWWWGALGGRQHTHCAAPEASEGAFEDWSAGEGAEELIPPPKNWPIGLERSFDLRSTIQTQDSLLRVKMAKKGVGPQCESWRTPPAPDPGSHRPSPPIFSTSFSFSCGHREHNATHFGTHCR